jgi:hypothetical protein
MRERGNKVCFELSMPAAPKNRPPVVFLRPLSLWATCLNGLKTRLKQRLEGMSDLGLIKT